MPSAAAAFAVIAPRAAGGTALAAVPADARAAFGHVLNTVLATQGVQAQAARPQATQTLTQTPVQQAQAPQTQVSQAHAAQTKGVLDQGIQTQATQVPGAQTTLVLTGAQATNKTDAATPGAGAATAATKPDLLKQLAADKAQAATTPVGATQAAVSQATSALAAVQAVVHNAQSQVSPSTAAGIGDILQQAVAGSAGTAGADQARLASLTQELNKLEARTTGVDPSAPPQGWSEPQVFAQARGVLNKMLGGAPMATAATTKTTGDPLATAGMPVAGATTSQSAAAQQTQVAQASPSGQIAAAAQSAQATNAPATAALTTPVATRPLQAADAGATAPLTAPAQTQEQAAPAPDSHSLTSGDANAHAAPAVAAQTAQAAPAVHAKADDHADAADADASSEAQADATQGPDAAKASDQATPVAANTVQAQAQTQAANATTAATLNDPSHAMPQATAYLAAQMVNRLNGKSSQFDIELHPADLGRVDVQMRIQQDGRLNATLAFDNPAAAAEFRARSGELRQQLEQAGFHLSDDALSFTDRNAQGFGQQASQSFDQNSGSGASWDQSGSRARAFRDSDITTQAADAAMKSSSGTVRGLDMRV